jgi:hypothetical protein
MFARYGFIVLAFALFGLITYPQRAGAQIPPDSPAGQAAARTAATNEQLKADRQLQSDRDVRRGNVIREVDKSALPPKGDLEFQRDWKKKIRSAADAPAMTAKEQALFRALNAPVSVRFKNARLSEVLEELKSVSSQSILIDAAALEAASISYDTTVSLNLKNVSLRTALRRLGRDLGLTYIIKDESVQFVTVERARELMVVRAYYIGDLMGDLLFARRRAAQLIDLIQTTIDPPSWLVNGGSGTIEFNRATLSLVIKQTAEFHGSFGGGAGSKER